MVFSHSRVECFEQCPRKFKYRYLDGIETIRNDDPADPLRLGTALHRGVETDAKTAIHEYLMSYPVITDEQINETIKLEIMIAKIKAALPPNGLKEVRINGKHFVGFIDYLVPVKTVKTWKSAGCVEPNSSEVMGCESTKSNEFHLYDFKYSNAVDRYAVSRQLHEYKYFFEKENPQNRITKMWFVMVPKVTSKQGAHEDLYSYRQRIRAECEASEIQFLPIEYDPAKVLDFYELTQDINTETEFAKKKSFLCRFCEYEEYCTKGNDFMNLPSTNRRTIGETKKRKIWIYGAPFSGKTSMLDKAPNPLNLNTDGNISFVTMPFIKIGDEVTVEGRQTKRKFAWEIFKETIDELEKKQNDFKTIIVDLVEDTREMCRLYKFDELGIQHESDSGYGKGWDIIKTEYLSTLRRFFNLDYENLVIVSHEVSSEIKKKNGQTITKVSVNLSENIASKIAGMVDIVARVVVEDDGNRTLNFKSNEYVFGGGRLSNMTETTIPLDWDELIRVYDESEGAKKPSKREPVKVTAEPEKPAEDEKTDIVVEVIETPPEIAPEPMEEPAEQPRRRTRKVRE